MPSHLISPYQATEDPFEIKKSNAGKIAQGNIVKKQGSLEESLADDSGCQLRSAIPSLDAVECCQNQKKMEVGNG